MVTPSDDPYAPTTPGLPILRGGESTEITPTTSGGSPPAAGGKASAPGLAGRRLGDYEILETLGEGGMGIVYRARDGSLDREVALKILQPALAQDQEYERRFIREAKMAAKLDHPNIVSVYTAGRSGNVLFIAMQLVRGRTLHQILRERRRLPVAEALGIVRQAAEALDTAHKAGLVHRDIKPNNIMVDAEGRVKIMDFGLMRSRLEGDAITRSGDFFGTPEYASPEQCETSELDGRSDLYSLGAVLYEMLAGRMPHKAETPLALFKKILNEKPPALRKMNREVPPAVEGLVNKLLAKKPSERFASARELVAEIDRIATGGKERPSSKRVLALGASGVLVLALAAGLAFRPKPESTASSGTSGSEASAASTISAPQKLRLAVFDLANGTAEAQTAWYEIALSDLLIAALSQHPSLDVPTRDQMLWKVKEMRLDGPAGEDHRRVLTHELGAVAYLSGKYYVRGGKIRLTLAGYRLPDNAPLFPTKTFERGEDDMFALIDLAARAVAIDLEKGLSGSVEQVSAAAPIRSCQDVAVAYLRPGPRSERNQDGRAGGEVGRRGASGEGDRAIVARAGKSAPSPGPKEPPRLAADKLEKAPPSPEAKPGSVKAEAKIGGLKDPRLPPAPPPQEAAAIAQENPRKQLSESAVSAELAKAWYESRQALEQGKFSREEFEAIDQSLRGQFQAGPGGWKRVAQNRKEGQVPGRESRLKTAPSKIEFVCRDCDETFPEFGRCANCDAVLVLRVKAAGIGKKE